MATVIKQNVKLALYRRRRKTVHEHVTKGAIRRLARRGGVKRLSALIYDEMRTVLQKYLERLVRDSVIYCEYSNRKTVEAQDVIRALRCRGERLFGFDDPPFPISIRSSIVLADIPSVTEESIPSVSEIAETPENNAEGSVNLEASANAEMSDSLISTEENDSLLIKENIKNSNVSKARVRDTEAPVHDPVPSTSYSSVSTRARELPLTERRKKILRHIRNTVKSLKDSNKNTGRHTMDMTISSDSDDFQDNLDILKKNNRKSSSKNK